MLLTRKFTIFIFYIQIILYLIFGLIILITSPRSIDSAVVVKVDALQFIAIVLSIIELHE